MKLHSLRINARPTRDFCRIRRGGIAQPRDFGWSKPPLMSARNGKARLGIKLPDKLPPAQFSAHCNDQKRGEECCHRRDGDPGTHFFSTFFGSGVLGTKARLQIGPDRCEWGSVPFEVGQGRSFQDVDALDRIFQCCQQFARWITANDGGEVSIGPCRDPNLQLPHPEFFQG